MRVLITGGAGFVGGVLARHFRDLSSTNSVVVLDNLRRRGSEMNLSSLLSAGVSFVHGDVRNPSDLEGLEGTFDLLIEASAEPSVLAGVGASPRYVLDTNLLGAMNCLEFARQRCGGLVFLSSSRVYSIGPLRNLPLREGPTRFDLGEDHLPLMGVTRSGISEKFPTDSYRSFYGTSKLAAEHLCQEYAAQTGLKVAINRCGVIAGPGQYGKTDQGVFTLWVARHHFGRPLKYTGFTGRGHQVRDLLHPDDLCDLITMQVAAWDLVSGKTFNVGGGLQGSVSLQEYTTLCREVVGREVAITEEPTTNPVDIPWYVSDHSMVTSVVGWEPRRRPRQIVEDIAAWIRDNESDLSRIIV